MESDSATILRGSYVASLLRKRDAASHKGDHGHALLLAGDKGRMGAAVIAASACLRTGVGLLTVSVPAAERSILQVAIPEAMVSMREDPVNVAAFNAIGMGPAMGTGTASQDIISRLIGEIQQPLLLDADALTFLSQQKNYWAKLPAGTVLTPHPGEFDRMFGSHTNIAERNARAIQLSLTYPWVIVLKGQHTQIAYQGKAWSNTTGNVGLAKGGSGDALTGMLLGLLAQGYDSLTSAMIGVHLHGLAADIAVREQSLESLLATDVIASIGKAFRLLESQTA